MGVIKTACGVFLGIVAAFVAYAIYISVGMVLLIGGCFYCMDGCVHGNRNPPQYFAPAPAVSPADRIIRPEFHDPPAARKTSPDAEVPVLPPLPDEDAEIKIPQRAK